MSPYERAGMDYKPVNRHGIYAGTTVHRAEMAIYVSRIRLLQALHVKEAIARAITHAPTIGPNTMA